MKQNMPSTTATTIQATVLSPSIAKVVNVPRPRAKGFIIELLVQVICANPNGWHYEYSHMGYMKKIFKRKSDAATYYNSHNKHMRPLNAHGSYRSDWDPNTKLMCIVREYKGCEQLLIPSTFFIFAD